LNSQSKSNEPKDAQVEAALQDDLERGDRADPIGVRWASTD
jgi:hypothetical protein